MNTFTRFFKDTKKYYAYSIRAGKAQLKSEIAGSYLSFLWWVLDPLLFMLVYTFVAKIVFGKSEEYFAAFIFIGYNSYKLFERTLKTSVKLIARNKSVVKNVYVPKVILLFKELYVSLFQFAISFMLVFITMAIYRVPLTWKVVYFIPLVLLLVILSEGIGLFVMHIGVYVQDLANVINVLLRLLFYMSGVFYNLGTRLEGEKILQFLLLKVNPIGFIINDMRLALLYDGDFHYKVFFGWLAIAIILFVLGVKLVYKNENNYVKVI